MPGPLASYIAVAAERPPPPKGLSGPRAPFEREPAAPPDPRVPRAPPGSRPEVPPRALPRPGPALLRSAVRLGPARGRDRRCLRLDARHREHDLDPPGIRPPPRPDGGDLSAWVDRATERSWRRELGDFRHRWIRGDQLGYLAVRLRSVYAVHASLEDVFLSGMEGGQGFEGGLDALAGALRSPERERAIVPPGYDRLFPSPRGRSKSPCKRLTLFVRWMVRSEYPDLGLWTRVPASALRIPLDQHVYWIAYHLGLTHRRTRSWKTVEEVTEALRAIDPVDPVRYDFVLCHTGISGDCPKRRDMAVCGPCSVRPDCLLWRTHGGGS